MKWKLQTSFVKNVLPEVNVAQKNSILQLLQTVLSSVDILSRLTVDPVSSAMQILILVTFFLIIAHNRLEEREVDGGDGKGPPSLAFFRK